MEELDVLFILICISIILSVFFIDLVRKLSIKFNLFDRPNERSSHKYKIPTLGGIAIGLVWFFILYLYTVLFATELSIESSSSRDNIYTFMLMGLCISVIGIYDDTRGINPLYKALVQLFVFFILLRLDNSMINSFYGLFGIYEIERNTSILFSCFVFIGIINAINLVDGIDGLSASLTLFFLLVYSFISYKSGSQNFYILLPFASTIIIFLTYNYSKEKKIFLGDTGSLGFGLLLATISLSILNTNQPFQEYIPINPALFVVLTLSYPLLDVVRVFVLRLYKRKSPFEPDRSHLHHVLIDKGFSHGKAVILIILFQLSLLLINIFIINQLVFHTQLLVNIFIVSITIVILNKIQLKD